MTIKVISPALNSAIEASDSDGVGSNKHEQAPKPLARLKTQRLRDKERLIELNGRLEDYLEKVRLLETENNGLIEVIADLKQKMINSTATVKNDYEFPLNILKNSLNAEMTNETTARLKLRRLAYMVEMVKLKVRIIHIVNL